MPMVEGLEVTIRYHGAKYDQVAAATIASSELAILKKDLTHLRVHSPSQKNFRRVNGSFILHWPAPSTSPSPKVVGLAVRGHWSNIVVLIMLMPVPCCVDLGFTACAMVQIM